MTGKNGDPLGLPALAYAVEQVVAEHKRGEDMDEGWLLDIAQQLRTLAARTTPDSVTAALLRAAAAGRREYAGPSGSGSPPVDRMRDGLLAEAATLDTAARIADGDFTPLYGLLPSWRWTEAMDKRVLAGTSDAVTADDVSALVARSPQPTPVEPLYRYTGPRRTGQVVDPHDDLAAIEHLIREAPADYPGLPGLRARRDELRA